MESIAIIKNSAAALQQHGVEITTRMYQRLFEDEAIKALFDQAAMTSNKQPERLAAAILAFARNVDNLNALTPAIKRIAQRHVAAHIKPEHYPAVATALLLAIKDVLGDAIDAKATAAWGDAYWLLADVLISHERTMYAEPT